MIKTITAAVSFLIERWIDTMGGVSRPFQASHGDIVELFPTPIFAVTDGANATAGQTVELNAFLTDAIINQQNPPEP